MGEDVIPGVNQMRVKLLSFLRSFSLGAKLVDALKCRRALALTEYEKKALAFYQTFLPSHAVIFDVGSNLGTRTKVFSRMAPQVISIEPQQSCVCFLQWMFQGVRSVVIVPKGIGREKGEATLHLTQFSELATTSQDYIHDLQSSGRLEKFQWDRSEKIAVTTLDALVEEFGTPGFIKIDIEGGELEALRGLTSAPQMLSFEFHAERVHVAFECLEYLRSLGACSANLSYGETMAFVFDHWVPLEEVEQLLLSHKGTNSALGDIYVRFERKDEV